MIEVYLSQVEKTELQKSKIRSVLNKLVRFRDNVTTVSELVETFANKPECKLSYTCGTSRKVNGERFATKPTWVIMALDEMGYMGGPTISKIEAEYANWIMGGRFNIEEMTKKADEDYRKNKKAS